MEKTSSNTLSASFSLTGFIEFLFFDLLLKWVSGFKKFYSTSHSLLQRPVQFIFTDSQCWLERKNSDSDLLKNKVNANEKVDGVKLSRDDMEVVMEKLRIVYNHDEKRLGSDELSVLFKDEEPSVEEVKEAFNVFDENRDGFVDAAELQQVLCSLGFTEGSKIENCEKMIRAFDENADGRMDFNEFFKLMEKSFC